MEKKYKFIAGLLIFIAGAAVAGWGYNQVVQCNTLAGQISTFLNSLVGGSAAQVCYNSGLLEVCGVIVAIIGLIVILLALRSGGRKRR